MPHSSTGIDVGLTVFAVLSNGEAIDNPRFAKKAERELRRTSKSLSRKQKGSKNRVKARTALASVYQKIAAQRRDFAHQESRKLVNRFDLIGFEKLNIAGLSRGRLGKFILDAAWGMFLKFVVYKAANAGKHAVPVRAAGTSQECPWCGEIVPKVLSERQHRCQCWSQVLDRDHASAMVIEARALAVAGASLWRDGPLATGTRPASSPPDETGSHEALPCCWPGSLPDEVAP